MQLTDEVKIGPQAAPGQGARLRRFDTIAGANEAILSTRDPRPYSRSDVHEMRRFATWRPSSGCAFAPRTARLEVRTENAAMSEERLRR